MDPNLPANLNERTENIPEHAPDWSPGYIVHTRHTLNNTSKIHGVASHELLEPRKVSCVPHTCVGRSLCGGTVTKLETKMTSTKIFFCRSYLLRSIREFTTVYYVIVFKSGFYQGNANDISQQHDAHCISSPLPAISTPQTTYMGTAQAPTSSSPRLRCWRRWRHVSPQWRRLWRVESQHGPSRIYKKYTYVP